MDNIEKAKKYIKNASKIMVLSGAGLSTEAGILDFRSKNGLYSKNFHGYNPESILSYSFYNSQPELFWDYLRENLNYVGIKPDYSYKKLAQLEEEGKISSIVTQNIDSLHLDAGSKNVIEVHGSLKRCYCDLCGKEYSYEYMMDKNVNSNCEVDNCKGTIRPDIVLYEEDVPKLISVYTEAEKADLLLVLGTSLKVYPIAQLPMTFINRGLPVIIINRDTTPYINAPNVVEINESIGDTLKKII